MGFRKVLIGAASALVLSASVAHADYERDGWYVGLEGGYVSIPDTKLPGSKMNNISFDGGWAGLGTVGYALADSNWRIEGELGYRKNNFGATVPVNVLVAVVNSPVDGELVEWSGMMNAVYDFKLHSERFGLSLGAGIGADSVRAQAVRGVIVDKDKEMRFAAQAIAGMTYRMSDHWDLDLNYRYLWVNDPKLALNVGQVGGAIDSDMDLEKHTFTLGFRWGYRSPVVPVVAPPPVVVPPPAPKQFIIFFGFNKCNITAEADAVLSEAASAAKSTGAASVKIVGHTDTSGSPKYNQKLSECRANAAKANLVGKGVADGSISTIGKGESELMVQTGDGVKEPQNRRATIDLN